MLIFHKSNISKLLHLTKFAFTKCQIVGIFGDKKWVFDPACVANVLYEPNQIDKELIFLRWWVESCFCIKGRMKGKLSKSYFKANEAWETAVSLLLLFYLLPCMAFSLHSFLPLHVYGMGNIITYLVENHQVHCV